MPLPAPASTPVAALKLSIQPEKHNSGEGRPDHFPPPTWLWVSPGGRHNAGPDDGDGQAGSLSLQEVLGQSFSEGVGVGLGANDDRRHLGTVEFVS